MKTIIPVTVRYCTNLRAAADLPLDVIVQAQFVRSDYSEMGAKAALAKYTDAQHRLSKAQANSLIGAALVIKYAAEAEAEAAATFGLWAHKHNITPVQVQRVINVMKTEKTEDGKLKKITFSSLSARVRNVKSGKAAPQPKTADETIIRTCKQLDKLPGVPSVAQAEALLRKAQAIADKSRLAYGVPIYS